MTNIYKLILLITLNVNSSESNESDTEDVISYESFVDLLSGLNFNNSLKTVSLKKKWFFPGIKEEEIKRLLYEDYKRDMLKDYKKHTIENYIDSELEDNDSSNNLSGKKNNNKKFNFLNDTEFTMTDSINTIKEKLEKEEEKIDLMIDTLIKKEFENYQLFKENPNEKHNLIQEHRNLYIKIHSKSKEVLEILYKYIDFHKKDMGKYVLDNNKETKLYSNMKNYLMENVCKVYNENINDNLPDILNIDNKKNRIFTVNKKEMYDVIDFIGKFFSKRLLNSEDILEDLQVSKDLVLDSINIKDKNFFYKIIDTIKQIFFKNRIDTEELQKISKEKLMQLMIQYNKEVILLTDNIKPINIDLFKKKELEINENFQKLMNNNIKNNIPMMKNFFIKLVDGIKKKEELREKDKGYLNIYDEEQQKWENFALKDYLVERREIINYI